MKKLFVQDVKTVMVMDEVPLELVVNWDQTGLKYVPVSEWTMAEEGSKRVERQPNVCRHMNSPKNGALLILPIIGATGTTWSCTFIL